MPSSSLKIIQQLASVPMWTMASLARRVHAKGGVQMIFDSASSLLWRLLGVVGVESVLMACMGSVSSPPSAVQDSQQSELYQACEASSKRETRLVSRKKVALRPFLRASAGRSLGGGGRRAMLALVSAVHVDLAEGKWLIEFPPGVRCTWNDLPHGLQFAILFLMLGILYGVNRLFDKADEAMYTRLSCATAGLPRERRRQHAPHLVCLYAVNRLFQEADKTMLARLSSATRDWIQQKREERYVPAAAPVASVTSTHASAMPPAANPGPPTPASDEPAVPVPDPADMEAAAPAAATASAQPEPPRRVGRGRTFLGALWLGSLRALSLGSRIATNVANAASCLCEALSDVAIVLGATVAA
ncbi:unnamed protein product [Ectocarpus sp. 12 AP-2014]